VALLGTVAGSGWLSLTTRWGARTGRRCGPRPAV